MFANIEFDDRDFDEPFYTRFDQASRPHVFVTKLRDRYGAHRARRWRPEAGALTRIEPSRKLDVNDVKMVLAAAEFAARFGLILDMHVTIDFGRMGIRTPADVQRALSAFTKCYSAWCTDRDFPPAWISAVEMDGENGLHAHVALFVKGGGHQDGTEHRRAFRAWAKGYTARRGEHIPRAIKVRGGRTPCLLTHWIIVSYLLKGYDRSQVLCSAANSPDGIEISLGDIIARSYRDAGPVGLKRRISVSNNLGPTRRAFGVPGRLDYLLPHSPDWSSLDISRAAPLTIEEKRAEDRGSPVPTPFRAVIDDGIYDVRRLYPPCFYDFVTKLAGSPGLVDEPEEDEEDLTLYLRRQNFDA